MPNTDIIREKLKSKKFLIGSHITGTDPQMTEIISSMGFDYLWIDTEHTAIDKGALINHLIAVRASGVPAFVRIPWNDATLAKPVLDMGADGIVFPMIKTVEDAKYAVSSCLYPPDGIRGFGPRRATRFGLDSVSDYIHSESRKIFKLLQIETREAVENIEGIARVPGVDVLIIGPMDLSGAFGKLAQEKDPEIQKIYRYVVEKAHEAEKPVLVSMGNYTYDGIKAWADMGVDMITVGNEPGYIFNGTKTTLQNAQAVLEDLQR